MLHEIVHANLHARGFDPDVKHQHGADFKAKIMRLIAAGAYNNLL